MNNLIFITSVLDPRDKLEYMSSSLSQMYKLVISESLFESMKNSLFELFDDYAVVFR